MKTTNQAPGMERVSTKQAASELNMDLFNLQYMLQHSMLPIGHAVKKEKGKRFTYYIYRGLLDAYKRSIAG